MNDIVYEPNHGFIINGDQNLYVSNIEPGETCWISPESMGVGKFQKINIRPGLELWLLNCIFKTEIESSYININQSLEFSFILSGQFRLKCSDCRKVDEYGGELQWVYRSNNQNPPCCFKAEIPVQSISMMVYPHFFSQYCENATFDLPPVIKNAFKPGNTSGASFLGGITPQVRCILEQIMECSLTGINRKLFLESRTLELLNIQISRLAETEFDIEKLTRLHPQDKDQTELARNILLNNIEMPPSLEDLARTAGMSHPKLNRCFKRLYGMTVFQYLRYERLNIAKKMLENQGMSVAEAAYKVGYESPSHFSQTYKKHFGNLPSTCKKT